MAEDFEENRAHLHSVAFRMLGSATEADDAVQEAWLRLNRSDTTAVNNLRSWLTTVVSRVCLDMLRSRKSRREEQLAEVIDIHASDSEHEQVELADSIGTALLVVLDALSPAERLAFVLHDMFAISFDEIAPIVDRSPAAARQLASRARRRVQSANADGVVDTLRQREVVAAFLRASQSGDLDALVALLDPDVVIRADRTAIEMGAAAEVRGVEAVTNRVLGGAKVAKLALIDGSVGWLWSQGGKPKVAFDIITDGTHIISVDLISDPEALEELEWELLK